MIALNGPGRTVLLRKCAKKALPFYSKRLTLPRSGTEREVGGMISARRRKNTVRESRMEMERETFSPESDGR